MLLPFVGSNPVSGRTIAGGEHPFAGLQADAVAAFQIFENFLRHLPPFGDDFGQLFEQRFGHELRFNFVLNR